jgi:hypothetical protein
MKRNSRKKKRSNVIRLRTWTHAQAQSAQPYVASVVRSVRDHFLEAIRGHNRVEDLGKRPGRPDRDSIIAKEAAQREFDDAKARFDDAENELNRLDIYILDPVQGLALIPFIQEERLAWYIFDLFDKEQLRFWRFQEDPLEMRRPVQDVA